MEQSRHWRVTSRDTCTASRLHILVQICIALSDKSPPFSHDSLASACHDTQALEEVKLREVALVELQKRLGDDEGRLKQQQALYEAVRADRNMYSKSLIEAQVGAAWSAFTEG